MLNLVIDNGPQAKISEGALRPLKGKASFIVGGQWGSEAKGAAAAWLAYDLAKEGRFYDIVTTNAGAQAGHTSIHDGKKRVVYHLPTAPMITEQCLGKNVSVTYLNAGSVIDPEGLEKELNDHYPKSGVFLIHPMAAVITDECREAEQRSDSSTTKIASTRKGVGQAIARKIARSGLVANDHPFLKQFCRRLDLNLNLSRGASILCEVPQGVSLSLNHSRFYPYTTSRDCIPSSAMGDAAIHPKLYGETMVVLRTFPIRVGNIVEDGQTLGESGGHYPDQSETNWDALGVPVEITTVTKRVRRVFTFSMQQIVDTFGLCRPDVVFLAFCDYLKDEGHLDRIIDMINTAARVNYVQPPKVIVSYGPTTGDVK